MFKHNTNIPKLSQTATICHVSPRKQGILSSRKPKVATKEISLSARKKDANRHSEQQLRKSKLNAKILNFSHSTLQLSPKKRSEAEQRDGQEQTDATGISSNQGNEQNSSQLNLLEFLNLDSKGFIKINSLFNGDINKDLIHKYNTMSIKYYDDDNQLDNLSQRISTPQDSQKNLKNSNSMMDMNKGSSTSSFESNQKQSSKQLKQEQSKKLKVVESVPNFHTDTQANSLRHTSPSNKYTSSKSKETQAKTGKVRKNSSDKRKVFTDSKKPVIHSARPAPIGSDKKTQKDSSLLSKTKNRSSKQVVKLTFKQNPQQPAQVLKRTRSSSKTKEKQKVQTKTNQDLINECDLTLNNGSSFRTLITPDKPSFQMEEPFHFSSIDHSQDNYYEVPSLAPIPECEQAASIEKAVSVMQKSQSTKKIKVPSLDLSKTCQPLKQMELIPSDTFKTQISHQEELKLGTMTPQLSTSSEKEQQELFEMNELLLKQLNQALQKQEDMLKMQIKKQTKK